MANKKDLLIVEMSTSQLKVAEGENKDYILEGIFGQIDQKNKNNRIYTESEYVPQIQQLQDKIKSSKLLGELDHPQQFDVSLKNVSHVIEELTYDKESKEVRGRIRLLDTDAGRQAKALVDAGVPLQISSRAAGAVESNGKVKIKQLFTYDLVADPGFANAELKRVNESYGFDDNSGLWIYEMNEDTQEATQDIENNLETNNKNKNMAEFVKAEDFNKYSEYLANEMKSIKESIGAKNEDNTLEDVKSHNDHIVGSVNSLSEYVEYLAGKLDESIQYTEHVAEKADQGISYTESVAEKLDQGIQYSEHLAESITKVKDFADYLAENHNDGADTHKKLMEYIDYLKESIQSVSEYAEYIAESINESAPVVEETEEVTEDEAGEGAEEIEADLEDVTEVGPEGETEEGTDEAPEDVEAAEETEEEVEESAIDTYKKEISSKLDALVEAAQVKENENPAFLNVVSGSVQEAYNTLNEDAKTEVRNRIAKRAFMNESQISSIIENATLVVEARNNEPFFMTAIPAEYKEKFESLTEAKQEQIKAQANYHTLKTEYQVRNFWETRDLREVKIDLEKLAAVNESATADKKDEPLYDVTDMAAALKKRFRK